MRFGSRGPRKFLRHRQTRRSETFCLTWDGAFGSGRVVNNFSALMKDVQQPVNLEDLAVDFGLQHFTLCLLVNEGDEETNS